MTVAEAGADYVAFGGFDDDGPTEATLALTAWWAALTTVPCVAAGCGGPEDATLLRDAGADFIAVGPSLWPDPERISAIGVVLGAGGKS
jgi:thiamine monophosphate synthase